MPILPKLSTAEIRKIAKQRVAASPEGVRWTTLVKGISADSPDTPENTIWGSTQTLFKNDPEIIKISKGIYALKQPETVLPNEAETPSPVEIEVAGCKESDFYASFADWLRDGLDEVTEAIAIGGNIFKGKWNTPDVIGVLRPLRGDLIKFEPQIVSAEIKIDPAQPVTAFGQAISYRLFSHKCYLVLPRTTSEDDLDRVEALATVFGLGLVVFDLDKDDPNYELVSRASLAAPDMVYVNQMAKRLSAHDSKAFDRLF